MIELVPFIFTVTVVVVCLVALARFCIAFDYDVERRPKQPRPAGSPVGVKKGVAE